MLNSVEWKYFKLEDLFEIEKLSNTTSKRAESCISNTKKNTVAYITRSVNNNGVKFFCNKKMIEKEKIKIFKKNAIIIGGEATECFYTENPFITGNNITILTNNNLNKYIGLFIITIIDREFYRYSYGRGFTMTRIRNTSIKLPVDSDGDPNWEFMEEYMRKISKGNLEGFNLPKNEKRLKLNDREWDEFKLEDLFEIKKLPNTTSKRAENCVSNTKKNTIAYITRSVNNNGVKFFCNKKMIEKEKIKIFKKNAIIIGGEATECFYTENPFITGNNISILTDNNLNKYIGLFIITIIDREFYRYSYGRGFTMTRIKNTSIKLPIKPKSSPDEKSEPDWEFMENYIRGLPYTNKL